MSRTGNCPVCGDGFGTLQPCADRTVFYHEDLADRKVYCIEHASGEVEERVVSETYPEELRA